MVVLVRALVSGWIMCMMLSAIHRTNNMLSYMKNNGSKILIESLYEISYVVVSLSVSIFLMTLESLIRSLV